MSKAMKGLCGTSLRIQTLIFAKEKYTVKQAKKWLKEWGFLYGSVDEKEGILRFRQESPDDFKEGSFRTTNFHGKLPEGIQAVTACPKHQSWHASMEKGGDVPEIKIELIDYSVSVYEDDFEKGEGANVNNWNKKENITFDSAEDLLKYLTTKVIYKDLAKADFTAFEDGRITTSVTVDVNNYPASDSEIEKWKKGEMALYSAHFDFYIALTERKTPTVEEMAKLFDIPSYKDGGEIMEKGGSVKGAAKNKVLFDEEPLRIEMKDGVVNFDFDSRFKTGWSFDTNDVGEAAAIIRTSKFGENKAVTSIPVSKKQKEEINFFDIIYWLSGGNKEWRGGSFYTADYEVVYEKCFKKLFEQKLKDEVKGAKTIGDLIDIYNQREFSWQNFAEEAMGCNFADGEDEDEMAKGGSVPAKGTPEYYQLQMAKKIAKNPQLSGTVYMMSVKEAEKILNKTIKTEYPSFGEDFKEISDNDSTILYARDFRDCEIDGQKIPLVAVATIRDLSKLVNEDELGDEPPFDVTIEVFANPAFVAKKHWDSVRDMTGLDDSMDDMELFRDLADGYMSGARVASEAFKTKIKALEYLMGDKLKSKLDVDAAMVGFVLDRPVNRIGTTGWDVIKNMVNAGSKLYAKGGEVADEERMIIVSLSKLVEYSDKIPAIVKGYSHLPAWIVSKISKVEQAIASVKHTLEPQHPQLFEKGGFVDKESDGDYISMQCRHIGKYSKALLAATKKGLKYEAWMKYLIFLSGDYVDSVYHFMDYKVNGKKYAKGGYVDTSSYIFVDADSNAPEVSEKVWEKYFNYPAKKFFEQLDGNGSDVFLFDYMVVQDGIDDNSPKYVISNYYKDMMAHKNELNYHVDQTTGLFAEGGSIEDKYKEVNGTSYHKETDAVVIAALESARSNNTRVKLYYGDVATGKNWNEEHDTIGTIGRSSGKIKVPLLIATSRSSGGGAILDHCIVKIKDAKTGRVLYQNEKFINPVVEIVPSDLPAYTHNVNIDGELYSRHKSLKSAQMLQKKMMEDGGEVEKFEKGGGFGASGIVEVKPRHAHRDDVQELLSWLDKNEWKYERAATNESRRNAELPYVQIQIPDGCKFRISNDDMVKVNSLRDYLENKQWEFSNLYAKGGSVEHTNIGGMDVKVIDKDDENGKYLEVGKVIAIVEPTKTQLKRGYTLVNYMVQFEDGELWAYLREQIEVVTKPKKTTDIDAILEKAAKKDIALLKKQGAMTITDTSRGNLWMEYMGGVFKIRNQMGNKIFEGDEAGIIQFVKKAYIVEDKNNPSLYELELEAVPNTDFNKGSHEASIRIKKYKVGASSLEDAKEKWINFITDNDLGSGNVPPLYLYKDGKKFGMFSYNGRLWAVGANGLYGDTEIAVGGNDLRKYENGGDISSNIGKTYRPFTGNSPEHYVKVIAIDFDNITYRHKDGQEKTVKTKDFFDSWIQVAGSGSGIKTGDLVFCKDEGSRGLVGLVMTDEMEEGGNLGHNVYFRGLNGEEMFILNSEMEDVLPKHFEFADTYGDFMHYPNIAKRQGIVLNPKYLAALDDAHGFDEDDFMEKGGSVGEDLRVIGKIKSNGEKYFFSSESKGGDIAFGRQCKVKVLGRDYDGKGDYDFFYIEEEGTPKGEGTIYFGKWGEPSWIHSRAIIEYAKGGSVLSSSGHVNNLKEAEAWVAARVKYDSVQKKSGKADFLRSNMANPKFPKIVATYIADPKNEAKENVFIEAGYMEKGGSVGEVKEKDFGSWDINEYPNHLHKKTFAEAVKCADDLKENGDDAVVFLDSGEYLVAWREQESLRKRVYEKGGSVHPIVDGFLEVNLLEKYKTSGEDVEYEEAFNKMKAKGESVFSDENEKYGLKTGDVIQFIAGYNDDIKYTTKILGFDKDGDAYVLWDSYWFPVKLGDKRRQVKKMEKGGSIMDKASSFFNKAKAGVKQKLHDEKKKIALEVIDETRGKVRSAKDARFLHIADNLVEEKYAKGGQIQYDLRGDRKQRHMLTLEEFLAESKRSIGKDAMSQPSVIEIFKKHYVDAIQNAINKGWYVEDIEKGKMTADNAKELIEKAGIEVPKNILSAGKLEGVKYENGGWVNTKEFYSRKNNGVKGDAPPKFNEGDVVNEKNIGSGYLYRNKKIVSRRHSQGRDGMDGEYRGWWYRLDNGTEAHEGLLEASAGVSGKGSVFLGFDGNELKWIAYGEAEQNTKPKVGSVIEVTVNEVVYNHRMLSEKNYEQFIN